MLTIFWTLPIVFSAIMPDQDYSDRQAAHNSEYEQAWKNAPPEFLEAAAKRGIQAMREEYDSSTLEFNSNCSANAYYPDMAQEIDHYIDAVIEKHGVQNAVLIRAVYADLKIPMERELMIHRSELVGRIAGLLVSDERGNMQARTHALLHSIPRMAGTNGYPSIRASARHCKVSAEWLRRARDRWCAALEIQAPMESRKSDAAKAKYKANGLSSNHWRRQAYKAPLPPTT